MSTFDANFIERNINRFIRIRIGCLVIVTCQCQTADIRIHGF